jgi:hypothetical protein
MRPNWREVMAKLKQLALPSTMVCQDLALDGDCCRLAQLLSLPHDGGDICNFINNVLMPLCEKLEVVIKFISTTRVMSEDEVEAGCAACTGYVAMYRELLDVASKTKHPVLQENTSIIPKMHILEVHIPAFAREWRTVGFFGEDVIETLHKDYNELNRRYCSVRTVEVKMAVRDDFKNLKFEQAAIQIANRSR